jgi:UDP-2,3-diacylglucosamine hydrolase
MRPVLIVSDLHLCGERPAINRVFFDFLERHACGAGALYILGDLFEYWAGDDDLADSVHAEVVAGLRRVAERGVAVRVMHGNRDFMLGPGFERATGASLLGDTELVELHGTRTLLLHGDTLCTDDLRYQAYRANVRKRWLQRIFLALPLPARKLLVGEIRRHSRRDIADKPPEIMDVNQGAVEEALRAHGYPRLIHGHTHRHARHLHRVDGHDCERWVLADWYANGQFLSVTPEGIEDIPLPA